MKKLILLVILFLGAKSFAQTNGITYQAVILNPSGEQLPGVNNTNAPMVDKSICMQFQFIDEFSKLEYQETIQTKTDSFGMVNLVIGSGNQTGGYAAAFETIEWNALKKSMIVSINTDGSCSSFTEISDQPFTAVPFAFSAINSGNVTGVVDIQNGGTNAVTIIGAKTNLGLEKLDNTSDVNKPVSTAAQTVLNLKENLGNKSTSVTADGVSDTKYASVKAVKDYVDASTNSGSFALTDEATIRANADNTLQTNINTLSSTVTANATTATTATALKENAANKSTDVTLADATNTKFPTELAVKTYVDASTNTGGSALTNEAIIRANADVLLQNNINTVNTTVITNATATTAALGLKEDAINKSTTTTLGTSDVLFPTQNAVKTYVDSNITTVNVANTTLQATVNANATAATAAIAAVQVDVDANETASNTSDAALQTNIDALSSTVTLNNTASNTALAVVQADVDANETASNISDTTLQTNINTLSSTVTLNNTASNTALAVVQADVDANETVSNTSDAALQTNINTVNATVISNATTAANATALKEDTANKSTDVTLADATNTKFPTELAVKTYVDASTNTGGSALTNEATIRANADTTLQTNINTLDSTVTANATTAANATALKEDAANKSTDVTLADATNTKFPTELAVKTYVDASTNTGGSALTNEATIRANADTTLQTNINTLDSTVTANATTAANATALKEDAANKSTDVTLADATNTKFPTELAVKTYVDASTNTGGSALTNEATIRANADTTLQTNINTVNATVISNATATTAALGLKEDAINKSTTTTLGTSDVLFPTQNAVKTYVDSNITTVNTSTATLQATVNANATAATAAIAAVQSDVNQNETDGDAADVLLQNNINTLSSTVTANATTAANATALKANIASPIFTGTPTAPTAVVGTNTTQLATTAFVTAAAAAAAAAGITGSGTANKVPKFSSTSALSNSVISDDGTGVRIGGPGTYTGLNSDNNTRFMVEGGRESESIKMAFNGDPYVNELSFNFYSSAWKLRINRNSGDVQDFSFWRSVGGVDTEKMRLTSGGNLGIGVNPSQKLDVAGNMKFSGALMPNNLPGTAGQVLTSTGANTVPTWTTPAIYVPYNGASSAVNLGAFDLTVNGLTVGLGSGGIGSNTALGNGALKLNQTGQNNTAVGAGAVYYADGLTSDGSRISALGVRALHAEKGSGNTAVGYEAGHRGSIANTLTNSTFIGLSATAGNGTINNATAIGNGASVVASNTVQLGNNAITNVKTSGTLTAGAVTYPNAHNSIAGQVLTTNAAGLATWAAPAASTTNANLTGPITSVGNTTSVASQTGTGSTFVMNNSPTFTGTVSGIDKSMVGLTNVDNTSDVNKPVSTAGQTALALKEDAINKSTTTTLGTSDVLFPTQNAVKTYVDASTTSGGSALTNEATIRANADTTLTNDLAAEVSNRTNADTTLQTNINTLSSTVTTNASTAANATALKANIASPTFTGTVSGIDKTMVGLANVDNTTDLLKPISNATQTALDLKAPLASPILTGTPTAPTAVVGTNTTQLATTAFVTAAAAASSGVPYTGASGAVNLGAFDLKVNGLTVGKGNGSVGNNTAFGVDALKVNTGGHTNTATGIGSLQSNTTGAYNNAYGSNSLALNTTGNKNIAIGSASLLSNTSGSNNIATGHDALIINTSGSNNVAIGDSALSNNKLGQHNIAMGSSALQSNTTGSQNTGIGSGANVSSGALTNATAIGATAIVSASNTVQLGNNAITNVKTSGTLTAGAVTYPNAHNSIAGQVLTTNAAGLATWAAPAASTTNANLTGPITSVGNTTSVASQTGTGSTFVMNNSPTFTGTVSGIDKSMVGLTNVDNTSDVNKPVSTAGQTALALKEDAINKSTTTTLGTSDVLFPTQNAVKTYVDASTTSGGSALTNEATIRANADTTLTNDLAAEVSNRTNADTTLQTNINTLSSTVTTNASTAANATALKANIASPTFTGTVSGIDKTMVGLANVDNTTDLLKPISNATQTALDLKAPLASPILTGTPTAPTAVVGTNTTQLATTAFVTAAALTEFTDEYTTLPSIVNKYVFSGNNVASTRCVVKMYINGVRISNAACVVDGGRTFISYIPANNNNYVILAADRVQLDYSY